MLRCASGRVRRPAALGLVSLYDDDADCYINYSQGPFEFALLGSNRQVLRVRVAQLRSQDLKTQFAATPATAAPAAEVPVPGAAAGPKTTSAEGPAASIETTAP